MLFDNFLSVDDIDTFLQTVEVFAHIASVDAEDAVIVNLIVVNSTVDTCCRAIAYTNLVEVETARAYIESELARSAACNLSLECGPCVVVEYERIFGQCAAAFFYF